MARLWNYVFVKVHTWSPFFFATGLIVWALLCFTVLVFFIQFFGFTFGKFSFPIYVNYLSPAVLFAATSLAIATFIDNRNKTASEKQEGHDLLFLEKCLNEFEKVP